MKKKYIIYLLSAIFWSLVVVLYNLVGCTHDENDDQDPVERYDGRHAY